MLALWHCYEIPENKGGRVIWPTASYLSMWSVVPIASGPVRRNSSARSVAHFVESGSRDRTWANGQRKQGTFQGHFSSGLCPSIRPWLPKLPSFPNSPLYCEPINNHLTSQSPTSEPSCLRHYAFTMWDIGEHSISKPWYLHTLKTVAAKCDGSWL